MKQPTMQENWTDQAMKINPIAYILREHRPPFKNDLCCAYAIGTAPITQKYCCIYKDQTIGDDGFPCGWIVISKWQKHALKLSDASPKGNEIKILTVWYWFEKWDVFFIFNGCQRQLEILCGVSKWYAPHINGFILANKVSAFRAQQVYGERCSKTLANFIHFWAFSMKKACPDTIFTLSAGRTGTAWLSEF